VSHRLNARPLRAVLGAATIVVGCGSPDLQNYTHYASMPSDAGVADAPVVDAWVNNGPVGLHVVGNQIQDGSGKVIVLHGVNRSGSEYACVQNMGVFDGPADGPSVKVMTTSWPHVNAVRVPLNESCWLGINFNGAPATYSGAAYKNAIAQYVAVLHQYGLVPILDLHWVGPSTSLANASINQVPMPDADHATDFWTDVAKTFAGDTGVVFEPFNEPFPGSDGDSNPAWQCWRDGCTSYMLGPDGGYLPYQAVGMQGLVTAIRMAGATQVILLGGVQFSNALTQWLTFAPADPAGNLGAAWHVYNNNRCNSDQAPRTLAATVPVVATEIGENDCTGTFVSALMPWLDTGGVDGGAPNAIGYLAWSWDAFGACVPASAMKSNPFSLIADYGSGTPNGAYAQAVHDHIAALP
jgi:endoglucanase